MGTTSLLDQDIYQLNMAQLVFNRFPNVKVGYSFTCRNAEKTNFFKLICSQDLKDLFQHLNEIRAFEDDIEYLRNLGYFSEGFLCWLRGFRFNTEKDLVVTHFGDTTFSIDIRDDLPWTQGLFYEIFILSFLNERYATNYFSEAGTEFPEALAYSRLVKKIDEIHKNNAMRKETGPHFKLIEFGTRRRASFGWQEKVIKTFLNDEVIRTKNFVGTSNAYFAKKYNIPVIGTFSHQLPMVLQGIYPVQYSAKMAYQIWLDEFKGRWGIALTDTLGDDRFFNKDFTPTMVKTYDGVRHDSGCPFEFSQKVLNMYQTHKVDPKTKRIVFSDGLDIPLALKLFDAFGKSIQCSFGVGTNLTFDIPNVQAPAIVIKATTSNGQPVAKLSNNPSKASCKDSLYLDYLRHAVLKY